MINKLLQIGFKKVGKWIFQDNSLEYLLDIERNNINFLYAFIVDNNIKYIGKSTQTIQKRFNGYKNPGKDQRTNIKNNKKLIDELNKNKEIDIYIFIDSGLLLYGSFHINLAAGLEDSLIKQTNPEWNNLKSNLDKK